MQTRLKVKDKSPYRFVRYARASICLALIFAAIIGINALQVVSLLILPFSGKGFRMTSSIMVGCWGKAVIYAMENLAGIKFINTGADIPKKENAFLICNHQSWSDIIVVLPFINSKGRIGDIKYFVKDSIKFLPGPGWCIYFMDSIFLKRNWTRDSASIKQTFQKFYDNKIPFYLLSYLEGTRIKKPKLLASQAYAAKNSLPHLDHLLVPRTKGFIASMKGLRQVTDAVYDITIGHPEGTPGIWDIACGYVNEIHLHYRRYPINDLPKSDDKLTTWVLERFREKDVILDSFIKNQVFS